MVIGKDYYYSLMYPICCNKAKIRMKTLLLFVKTKHIEWVNVGKYMLQIVFVYWLQLHLCVIGVSEGEIGFGHVKFKG